MASVGQRNAQQANITGILTHPLSCSDGASDAASDGYDSSDNYNQDVSIAQISPTFVPETSAADDTGIDESYEILTALPVHEYDALHDEYVSSMEAERVRWFYKEASSGEKKWIPFNGYDSLRIEMQYREQEEHKMDVVKMTHLQEHDVVVRGGLYEVKLSTKTCSPIYWPSQEVCTVMRGLWFYDVDNSPIDEAEAERLEEEHLLKFEGQKYTLQVSTKGPNVHVIHSIQFKDYHVDWLSITQVYLHREAASSKLYRAVGSKLGWSKSGYTLRRGYHQVASTDDRPPDITHLVFVVHGIGHKMTQDSIIRSTNELREGCNKAADKLATAAAEQAATAAAAAATATSLATDKRTLHNSSSINDSSSSSSSSASETRAAHRPASPHHPSLATTMAHSLATGLGQQGEGHRVEYLPVEWRYELKLDGDIVHTVTPSKLRGIRDLLNSSVLDVLYYTSPVYRQEIIHALHSKLNRLYEMFISRNPQFVERGGKVSVVAHSLGCVLIHDILTGWNPIHQYEDYVSSTIEDEGSHIDNVSDLLKELKETRKRATALEDRLFAAVRSQHCHPLKFQVDSLFFLGSPLAVFLALRGVRPTASGSTEHIIARSLCRRVYNVYHPTDPVAYRLEPLVLKHYTQLMPLRVHRYDSSDMRPYESLPNIPYRDAKHDVSSATAAAAAAGATDPFTEIEEEAAKDSEAQSHRSHQSPSRFSGLFSRWSSKKVPAVSKTYIVDELSTIDSDASSASSTPTLPHKHPHTHPRASQSPTNSRAQSPTDHLVSLTNQATAYKDVICDNEPIIEHTDLEYRLDYQLHESKMAPQYYSALTSHTAYWTNPDVALFVYTQLLHTCAATRSKPPTHKL